MTDEFPSEPGPTEDVAEVAHRLRLATARLARLLRQQAGTGLSPSQSSVLASIEANGSLTLGELAAIEQVAPPTITKIVSKLEDDGLVVRAVDSRDRRVARVSISDVGRARLDQSRSRRDAWLTRRLAQASPTDITRLVDALDVLEALASGAGVSPGREQPATAPGTAGPAPAPPPAMPPSSPEPSSPQPSPPPPSSPGASSPEPSSPTVTR
jgi:DNA-binding MarR family transcriptional regulator